jgi:hypothetical protein
VASSSVAAGSFDAVVGWRHQPRPVDIGHPGDREGRRPAGIRDGNSGRWAVAASWRRAAVDSSRAARREMGSGDGAGRWAAVAAAGAKEP